VEKSRVIETQIGIGAGTRTVLATSMHVHSVDPWGGFWQGSPMRNWRLNENAVCLLQAPAHVRKDQET
jgi:hypothetical protein